MGRRARAGDGARGGEDIQALRTARTRLALAAGALACAAAVAAIPLARGSEAVLLPGVRVVALALVFLLAALVNGWPRLVPLPLLAIAGLYAVQLGVDDAPLDTAAPVVAAGLFTTAELAYWSLDERDRIVEEPGERLRRLAVLAGLALAALGAVTVLLLLIDSFRTRGLTVDVLGAAAAAGVVAAIVLLARGRVRTSP